MVSETKSTKHMFGESGHTILLIGKASVLLESDEIETIRNFLRTESGVSEIELQIDTLDMAPQTTDENDTGEEEKQ